MVLAGLGLFAAWTVLIPGVSHWDNAVAALIESLRLTGPVAAAFAAWAGARRRRTGAAPSLRAPLSVLGFAAGAFTVTTGVLAVKTVLGGGGGGPAAGGLLVALAGLGAHVAVGWAAGWAVPRALTPPLVGLACYGLVAWAAGRQAWWSLLAPLTHEREEVRDVFERFLPDLFLDQAVWLAGFAAVVLLGWLAAAARRPMLIAPMLLAALAASFGLSRVHLEYGTARPAPVAYSCREWPITVCVHPGMRPGLPELGEEFTAVAARLSRTPMVFTRVEQRPGDERSALPRGTVAIRVDDLAPGFAARAAADFVRRIAPCSDDYSGIVTSWLAGRPLPGGLSAGQRHAAAWFGSLAEPVRRDWLRRHYLTFTQCRLKPSHFSGFRQNLALPVSPPSAAPPALGWRSSEDAGGWGDTPVYAQVTAAGHRE
ncbi:hypothetical protein D5H75_29905 [Bailinhaonella thermotolerans]|uniref:Uncharacterized protein n=1 Tax=Bailinhaonella thermotolerans TaxID=1070861 RepID=A0A3A4AES2_9ACTN|nr:hypothetical protein D5H75_29905 [Bailinhaonella thermotolerans]